MHIPSANTEFVPGGLRGADPASDATASSMMTWYTLKSVGLVVALTTLAYLFGRRARRASR